MKELHVYQPANCIQLDSPAVNPTVRMLLTVLYELQHWLKAAPIVSRDTENGNTVCLLFRDCACTGEDLCQMFGSPWQISRRAGRRICMEQSPVPRKLSGTGLPGKKHSAG